jgi:putative endonuclease
MAPRSISTLFGFMEFVHSIADRLRPFEQRSVPAFEEARDAGFYGEKVAAFWLRHTHRYKVLVRNYHVRRGEIDLVCRHRNTLVFIEVKSRANEDFGRPADAVNREKQRRLHRAIEEYLREIGRPNISIRIDVVEVILLTGQKPECRLLTDVRFETV